ncbi:MAG: alpha/beta hydrolase [Mycobacterium sp.]|nr:alpha/beta hydrolase [Mycobacterium sp.]
MTQETPQSRPQNFPLVDQTPLYRDTGGHRIPTQLIWSTHDPVTRITSLDTARQLLRGKQTHARDCGHMAPYERPADVAAHLAAFIDSHSEGSNS